MGMEEESLKNRDMTSAKNLSYTPWTYEKPPTFEPFLFETLDYDSWKKFAAQNPMLGVYAAVIYLLVIFGLRRFMEDRQPLRLKQPLIWWNITMGVFALCGFLRTLQELVYILEMPDGLRKSLCDRIGLNQPAAFYSICFVFSKFIELGDTIFIVLRKHQLIFLHWYHHSISLVLAWKVMPYSEPIFRYLGVMNYGVHSIMFPYFALKVMNCHVPTLVPRMITVLQLLQFVAGVGINLYTAHLTNFSEPGSCARHPVSITWIGLVYASFMIVFTKFFLERHFPKKSKVN